MTLPLATIVSSIGWTLLHFLWEGLLLGCATAIALACLRRAKAEHRYTVACAGLLMCFAWPALGLYARLGGAGPGLIEAQFADTLLIASGAGTVSVQSYLQNKLVWIVGFWACCALALSARMALGLLWISHASRQQRSDPQWQARLSRMAEQFGVSRQVRLRVVDNLDSPVTAGWWRPVVLVPASLFTSMPPDLLEALLAHEMAHIKRLDYLVNLGQNVVEILLFFHPAVWWISGQIRLEREHIADAIAARELGEPRRLALALSELERFQFSTHHLAQAANGGNLMSRIKRLTRPDTQASNWKAAIPVLVLGFAAFVTACTSVAPPSAEHATAGIVHPKAMFASCAKPVYPPEAFKAGIGGTVALDFLISTEGKVVNAKIFESSGHSNLDNAARDGISKCSFKPGTRNGVAEEMSAKVKYVWYVK
ncbi:MAG: M56 family metallopeptidase [Pseudomonadota bacterium]